MISLPDSIEFRVSQHEQYDLQILKAEPLIRRPIDVVVATGSAFSRTYKGKGKNQQRGSDVAASSLYNPKDPQQTEKWMRHYGFGKGQYTLEEMAVADGLIKFLKELCGDGRIQEANRIYVRTIAPDSERTFDSDDNFNYETLSVKAVLTADLYKRGLFASLSRRKPQAVQQQPKRTQAGQARS